MAHTIGFKKPHQILVVDDDADIRESLRELFESKDYEVITACNGKDALGLLVHNKPSLILLDLRMPVMDGWEFCKSQQSDPALSDIPVFIFCAGHKAEARPADVEPVGMLNKPIDISELLNSISPYLQ